MPRNCTIHDDFFSHPRLSPLRPRDRLVYLGLCCMADRDGLVADEIKIIDGFIFPDSDESAKESLEVLLGRHAIDRCVIVEKNGDRRSVLELSTYCGVI